MGAHVYKGKESRPHYKVGRVELLYAGDTPVLVVSSVRKQVLEEIAITEQKHRAKGYYRQLVEQLNTYGDKEFWDIWGYTRQHQKWLKDKKDS
jgi:hypothetical protein